MFTKTTNLYDYPIILLKFIDYPDKNQALNVEIANQIYDSLSEEELELNKHLKIVYHDIIGMNFDIVDTRTNQVLDGYRLR